MEKQPWSTVAHTGDTAWGSLATHTKTKLNTTLKILALPLLRLHIKKILKSGHKNSLPRRCLQHSLNERKIERKMYKGFNYDDSLQ